MFASQLAAHLHTHLVDVAVGDVGIGSGEIDVLEDAEGFASGSRKGLDAVNALGVDDDDLTRFDVPDVLGLDQVKSAGL